MKRRNQRETYDRRIDEIDNVDAGLDVQCSPDNPREIEEKCLEK